MQSYTRPLQDMLGWFVLAHVASGQIKSAELNSASALSREMPSRPDTQGFARALCSWREGLL